MFTVGRVRIPPRTFVFPRRILVKMFFLSLADRWKHLSLVKRIILGLILGIILACVCPGLSGIAIFGDLFVRSLKAMAPVLVLLLVSSALSRHQSTPGRSKLGEIVCLYVIGMLMAGVLAVCINYVVQPVVMLNGISENASPPKGISEVLLNLVYSMVDNPVAAVCNSNYTGILFWAVVIGLAMRGMSESAKTVFSEAADSISIVISWIISCAPLGVMGLIYSAISSGGIQALASYGRLIAVLVSTMVIMALVVNPLIVFAKIRRNPYPLVLKCLRYSGITAFFTRSSAANIPVNLSLCEELKLDKGTYPISIPLGATINMEGASITIATLSMAAANTMGIQVGLPTAVVLCVIAAISACGASGVAGGSLLLVPLACSLFGIPESTAMQVVGAGFVIGVIQDSCETALNSSTDVLFTAAVDLAGKSAEETGI